MGKRRLLIIISIILILYFQISALSIKEEVGKKAFGQNYPSIVDQKEIGYKGIINKQWYSRDWVRIVPDDCLKLITVNNVQIDIGYIPQEKLCNWGKGFDFELGKYLKEGDNKLTFSIGDLGGTYTLGIVETPRIKNIKLLLILIIAMLFSFELSNLKIFSSLSKLERSLIVLGLIVRIIYLFNTPHEVRAYDIQGHKEYIELIAKNLWLPSINECVFCHKPFFYYGITGILWRGISYLGGVWEWLQWWQLLINMGFIYYLVKIVVNNLPNKSTRLMVLLPILFLPSSIIHSTRISPEPLVYLFVAGFYYYYLEWAKSNNDTDLLKSLWMLLFSLLSSLVGIIYLPIIVFLFIYKSAYKEYVVKRHISQMVAITVGMFAYLGFKMWNAASQSQDLLNGRIVLNDALKVGIDNTLRRYITIHGNYMNYGIDPWDKSESGYFLNYLLKTIVHTEFKMSNLPLPFKSIAELMQVVFLIMVIVMVIYVFKQTKRQWLENMPLLTMIFFPLMGLLWYSVTLYYTPSSDFRFIYPSIIPIMIFYTIAISNKRRGLWSLALRGFPLILGIGGLLTSVLGSLKF